MNFEEKISNVIGTAITGQEYFLAEHVGVAVAMMNAYIEKMCKKLNKEGD